MLKYSQIFGTLIDILDTLYNTLGIQVLQFRNVILYYLSVSVKCYLPKTVYFIFTSGMWWYLKLGKLKKSNYQMCGIRKSVSKSV